MDKNLKDHGLIQVYSRTNRTMGIKNVLSCFAKFSFDRLAMDGQCFEDYKGKYLDLYDKVKCYGQKEKVSILDDIDFELKMIHRDEINIGYIISLLRNMLDTETQLRSKN